MDNTKTVINRRKMGLTIVAAAATAHAQRGSVDGPTSIHQEVDYGTTPARIYEVLLDAKRFSALTKNKGEIEAKVGAPFKLFGGLIEGRNIELGPDKMIVQAWRPADWAPGLYSIVRFEFVARQSGGTRIVFDHWGFPEARKASLTQGWESHYWGPMHEYFNTICGARRWPNVVTGQQLFGGFNMAYTMSAAEMALSSFWSSHAGYYGSPEPVNHDTM